MKKTHSITLTLLASVTLMVTACNDDKPYKTIDECIADGKDAIECRTSMNVAKQEHDRTAPRYGSKDECEKEYGVGHCETGTNSNGTGFFMPFMAGYLMGNSFGRPAYVAPNGTYSSNATAVSKSVFSSSVSRGGFGGSAHSSFGG